MSDEKQNIKVGSFDKKILWLPKKVFFIIIGILVVALLAVGGYFVWKQSVHDPEETVIIDGEKYIIPSYIKDYESMNPMPEETKPNSEVIEDIESRIADEGVTEDPLTGDSSYMILAQLYQAEGDNEKAIEYYERARDYLDPGTVDDYEDRVALINSIINSMKQGVEN